MKGSKIELIYWKIFNAAARIVGIGFLIVGFVAAVDQATILVDTNSNKAIDFRFASGIIAIFLMTVGILLIKVKAYYPEHLRGKKEE